MVQDAYIMLLALFKLECLLGPSAQKSPKPWPSFKARLELTRWQQQATRAPKKISQSVPAPEKTKWWTSQTVSPRANPAMSGVNCRGYWGFTSSGDHTAIIIGHDKLWDNPTLTRPSLWLLWLLTYHIQPLTIMQLPQRLLLRQARIRNPQVPLVPQTPQCPVSFHRNHCRNLDPVWPVTGQSLCFHDSAIGTAFQGFLGGAVDYKKGMDHFVQQGIQELLYELASPELLGQAFELY